MKQLIMDIWFEWVCRCGHRQNPIENEEWPSHCKELMRYATVKKLRVEG